MKKLSLISFLFAIVLGLTSCVISEPKQFESSLRVGLFQGTPKDNEELTINIEFTEMDTMEFMKKDFYKIKDLSTIDTKFYTSYYVNFVLSEGNENYVVKFSEFVAKNNNTTDTYKIKKVNGDTFGRNLDLSHVTMKLMDMDNDKIVDELELEYKLNGKTDTANLKFISEGKMNDYDYHHRFEYECSLSYDENINFSYKFDSVFLAGKEIFYNIEKIKGYKVRMYVNGELYTEIDSTGVTVLQFRYVTGYRDVNIEFKSVVVN